MAWLDEYDGLAGSFSYPYPTSHVGVALAEAAAYCARSWFALHGADCRCS